MNLYVKKVVNRILIFTAMFVMVGALCACDSDVAPSVSSQDTGFMAALPGNYDSMDTAVVVKKDTENSTIQFMTLAIGKYYTLSYDGATTFADKYGNALSLAQVREGDVVDVTFMRSRKRLNSLAVSADMFSYSGVEEFTIHDSGRKITYAGEDYSLSQDIVIIGEKGKCELIDINSVDTLCLIGKDHTIYSIIIEKGHGYLRLAGQSFFVGGWLEVDQSYFYKVEEDMLIPVPTGNISVSISGGGSQGTETITIETGCEYEWDVSKWQAEAQQGTIYFTVDPYNSSVLIDDTEVDVTEAVVLDYGLHQLTVSAEGYITVTKYIKVSADVAYLSVDLEKEGSNSDDTETVSVNSVSDNSVSGNSSAGGDTSQNAETQTGVPTTSVYTTTSDRGLVYIDGPANVEVYLDGVYVGVSPVSFEKPENSAVVTLRLSGYQTRSYTLSFSDDNKDETYSFSDLIAIGDN